MSLVKIKNKRISVLKSVSREFESVLKFFGINKKVMFYFFDGDYYLEIDEFSIVLNYEFFNLNREEKILFLISRFFKDYKFIQFLYLKMYLRRQDKYILEKLRINEKELQKMKIKFLKKNFKIELY